MKKINKYILSVAVIASSWLGYGCNDFDYINTNPDATTSATPAMIATGQLWKALTVGGKTDAKWYFGDMFFTKQISWQEGSDDGRRVQYNQITTSGFSAYTDLTNVFKMVELAADIDKDAYHGLALFLKAFRLYDVSMTLGDIPYSDAFKGEEGNITPKYDMQKEVMLQILADLDESYRLFSSATRSFDGDIVYNGDCSKWKKAVSALQLRVLMAMSKKTGEADLNVAGRFASIVSGQSLFESNDDNFMLVYGSLSSQQYPLYLSRFNVYAGISNTILDVLKANNDYRVFYYCEPAPSSVAAGISADDMDAYKGVDPSRLYTDILSLHYSGDISNINNRFWEVDKGQPTIQMGYAELNFVLAEACLRGWINGDANVFFHKGLKASMEFASAYTPEAYRHGVNIDDAYMTSFLAQPALQLGCTSATFESDLKNVLTQKYIDLFMHNTYTSYYDFRRTGYPVLPVNPETNMNTVADKMPMRWRYEQREYDYNRENLDEALQRQFGGNDDWNELMWIIK